MAADPQTDTRQSSANRVGSLDPDSTTEDEILKVIKNITEVYESESLGGTETKQTQSSDNKIIDKKKSKHIEPQILNIQTVWHEIDKKIIDLPIRPATLTFELKGVNVAVASAFRRVLMDELNSPRLSIKPGTFHSTDPFMTEHFVRSRIESIPLLRILNPEVQKMKFSLYATHKLEQDKSPQMQSDDFKRNVERMQSETFRLNVERMHSDSKKLVLSEEIRPLHGKLSNPIMNPNFELAEIQEGSEIKIDEIFIEYGIGRNCSSFRASCNGSIKHLDLERYSSKEINSKGGKASYGSGYKDSSLLSNPREHQVTVTIPATLIISKDSHAKEMLRNACDIIITYNEKVRKEPRLHSTKKTKIIVPGMTDTICHIVSRYIHELLPEVSHKSPQCVPHKANIELTIEHTFTEIEIDKKLDSVFDYIDELFKSLKRQV